MKLVVKLPLPNLPYSYIKFVILYFFFIQKKNFVFHDMPENKIVHD